MTKKITINKPYLIHMHYLSFIYVTEIIEDSDGKQFMIKCLHDDFKEFKTKDSLIKAIQDKVSLVLSGEDTCMKETYIKLNNSLDLYEIDHIEDVISTFNLDYTGNFKISNDYVVKFATLIKNFEIPVFNQLEFASSETAIDFVKSITDHRATDILGNQPLVVYNPFDRCFMSVGGHMNLLYSEGKPCFFTSSTSKDLINELNLSDDGYIQIVEGAAESPFLGRFVDDDLHISEDVLFFSKLAPVYRHNSINPIMLLDSIYTMKLLKFIKDMKILNNQFISLNDLLSLYDTDYQTIKNDLKTHFINSVHRIIATSGIDKFIDINNESSLAKLNRENSARQRSTDDWLNIYRNSKMQVPNLQTFLCSLANQD